MVLVSKNSSWTCHTNNVYLKIIFTPSNTFEYVCSMCTMIHDTSYTKHDTMTIKERMWNGSAFHYKEKEKEIPEEPRSNNGDVYLIHNHKL